MLGKEFLTSLMGSADDLKFRKVKVSDKGQISVPVEVQREAGIKKGDELLLVRKGSRIILEKPVSVMKVLTDELADLSYLTEASLKRLWLRKGEDVWNSYLEGQPK